mmetsp:Transcript_47301/g.156815  ORF Transcript_47301/g.156815 Transcript_47301/m.156815 type:complete len:157 (-) Transcript_47301:888-1358(-)
MCTLVMLPRPKFISQRTTSQCPALRCVSCSTTSGGAAPNTLSKTPLFSRPARSRLSREAHHVLEELPREAAEHMAARPVLADQEEAAPLLPAAAPQARVEQGRCGFRRVEPRRNLCLAGRQPAQVQRRRELCRLGDARRLGQGEQGEHALVDQLLR